MENETNDIIDVEENEDNGTFSPVDEIQNLPVSTIGKKRRGVLGVKYRKIAALAVRGWSPVEIGKEVGVRPERISIILERDDVWESVIEEIRGLFSEGDRILASLYKKAMKGLDEDMSSTDPAVRRSAREQVLKLWGYGKNQPQDGEKSISLIQQFFGGGVEGAKPLIQSMDEIILQKRKERGLKTENK